MARDLKRRAALSLLIAGSLAVAGCGKDNRFVKILAPPPPETLEPDEGYLLASFDTRPLVPSVTAMAVEPTANGIIVRATGQTPVAGYWDADLVPLPRQGENDRELRLEFRIRPPANPPAATIPAHREIKTGTYLSRADLEGVAKITVIGIQNSRSSSR